MEQNITTVSADLPFESAMKRLEEIAGKLENGQATLDESLALYEEGIALIRHCNEQLNSAEQKVRMLNLTAADTEP
ncbi:MAG: exodeoxyribonuclease VII small subunit [Clostridia bacterium]|nr:exodeoxyribonuclease VII small subunit [Clostridia bacterium]